ncbi:MarR family winged helix-turn-helix transcriptional regulator [Vallicoccus soli]|uniref:MarR family transcriptional regulator n=1 Tax=Vallicoccus soli TaxID=2339232 RepID=A0A3A3Z3Y0_9ACTN|nr:MarR family transcriptional regulator [Vallicoccus soli]RJK96326.1 MarR family transcriptional regulator [Vallicoccus soli]
MTTPAEAVPRTADDAALSLEAQLCFALYSASRAMTGTYRPLLEPLGLTYPQYLVMLVLWQDGPTTVGRLGRKLQLDSGTLSPLLTRLETAGLIERRRHVGDDRVVDVHPTEQGRALRERALAVREGACEAVGMSDRERDALIVELRTLAARLGQR